MVTGSPVFSSGSVNLVNYRFVSVYFSFPVVFVYVCLFFWFFFLWWVCVCVSECLTLWFIYFTIVFTIMTVMTAWIFSLSLSLCVCFSRKPTIVRPQVSCVFIWAARNGASCRHFHCRKHCTCRLDPLIFIHWPCENDQCCRSCFLCQTVVCV